MLGFSDFCCCLSCGNPQEPNRPRTSCKKKPLTRLPVPIDGQLPIIGLHTGHHQGTRYDASSTSVTKACVCSFTSFNVFSYSQKRKRKKYIPVTWDGDLIASFSENRVHDGNVLAGEIKPTHPPSCSTQHPLHSPLESV